ncbi:thioesterase family protein [Nocardia sp. NPDC048505]|uniref:acyl-CoA thioesterase n=1 Tax=unclassified Nocardia TaxID=2637762 RepID=UPI0033C37EF5
MTETSASHLFDIAVALDPLGPGEFRGRTTSAYANIVGPFGGITAATMVRAIQLDSRHIGDPISLTVNYAGPIAEGDFVVSAQPVRTNRSTQHWSVTVIQRDQLVTTATAVFGSRRATWSATEALAPTVVSAPELPRAELSGLVSWVDNYDLRFIEGGIAPTHDLPTTSATTVWVCDHPARALDYPALTAMSDVFFPRVMLRLQRMVPAGTVSMTIYFHANRELLAAQSNRHVLAAARAQHFGNGFFDQSAQLWSDTGEPLVTTHQLVYFKA